jgi:hypothetical protein
MKVTLKWFSGPPIPRLELEKRSRPTLRNMGVYAGVYIAVDPKKPHDEVLQKVGVTTNFARRAMDYRQKKPVATYLRRSQSNSEDWLFYIAEIAAATGGRGYLVGGFAKHVENAIARTLFRAGHKLRAHDNPRDVASVRGALTITNILPPQLQTGTLLNAFAAKRDATPRSVQPQPVPSPFLPHVLQLDRGMRWEFE